MTGEHHPPVGFGSAPLTLKTEPAGSIWRRIYMSVHANPLGHAPALGRFSDPTGVRYGVVYLGSSVKVAFAEVLLRDRGAASAEPLTMRLAEIADYTCAQIRLAADLQLVDLTGDGCLRLRVPTDVIGARDQTIARAWSQAFFDHAASPDGVLYPSRLNEERNIALFARALGKLQPISTSRLIDLRDELAEIILAFRLDII